MTDKIDIEGPSNFTIYSLNNKGGDVLDYVKKHPGQYVLFIDGKADFFKTKSGLVKAIKKEFGSVKQAEDLSSLCDVHFSKLPSSVSSYHYHRKQPFYVAK